MANPEAESDKAEVDMDGLMRRMGKYALVVGVAKRARQLREYGRGQGDAAPATAITRAREEIAKHRVRLRMPEKEPGEDEGEEAAGESE
jgi:DNA-directed RNA polymerase subunit K/omega